MAIIIRDADWNGFRAVMGDKGGCGGCWCRLWRVSRKQHDADKGDGNRDAMRARIAEIAGVPVWRISVKATTNETIGFIGRREGIAAVATATAVFDPALERNGET